MDIISKETHSNAIVGLDKFTQLSIQEIKTMFIPTMNEMRYHNEESSENQFAGFNDGMMVAYYLFRDKHVDSSKTLSEKTINAYRAAITQFLSDFQNYGYELGFECTEVDSTGQWSILKSLKPRHVEKYTDWLQNHSPYVRGKGRKYSAASISQKVMILKSFLNKLYEWQYIEAPTHFAFKSVTLTKHDKPNRDVTPDQVKFLLDVLQKMHHFPLFCITHFLVTTGIRNTEICNLKVGDVNYDQMSQKYYITVIAKGNKNREIPLLQKTVDVLRIFRRLTGLQPFEEMALQDANAPLFTTSRGTAFTASYLDHYYERQMSRFPTLVKEEIKKRFTYTERENPLDKTSPIVEKQIKITPHVFRHAYAIISHHSGVDLDLIKDSLGHNDRKTTEIYLESVIKKERNAVNRWNTELMDGYL